MVPPVFCNRLRVPAGAGKMTAKTDLDQFDMCITLAVDLRSRKFRHPSACAAPCAASGPWHDLIWPVWVRYRRTATRLWPFGAKRGLRGGQGRLA